MLISTSSLLLFLSGAIILLLMPGPAVLYIVSRSVGHGRPAGLVSAMGIATGTLMHVAAATFGLSAVLVSSVFAFQFVKYFGAAYLIYLGIRILRGNEPQLTEPSSGQRNLRNIFAQGFLVNLLNPKTALFFLAFLPQFVDPARGHAELQILQLGLLFTLLGWLSDSAWALLAGTLAGLFLRGNVRLRRAQRNVAGGALIALGLASAAFSPKSR
jgi:threonine/homoserine/homoserine lactone efflux protein